MHLYCFGTTLADLQRHIGSDTSRLMADFICTRTLSLPHHSKVQLTDRHMADTFFFNARIVPSLLYPPQLGRTFGDFTCDNNL